MKQIEEAIAELLGTIIAMIIIFIIATFLIDRHFEKLAQKDVETRKLQWEANDRFHQRMKENLKQKMEQEMEKFNQ